MPAPTSRPNEPPPPAPDRPDAADGRGSGPPIGSGLTAIGLGLLAGAVWGAADFGGGLAARRAPVVGILLLSQVMGMGAAAAVAVVRGEALPSAGDAAWAAVAGVGGGLGLAGLYRALAGGAMGIVAPISGVLAATIPVAVGILIAGPPGPTRLAGFVLGATAIILVSAADDGSTGLAGLRLAIGAGLCLGIFNTAIARVSPGVVFWALVVARGSAALAVGGMAAGGRQPWRVPRRLVAAGILVGVLDMSGNAFYVLAAQSGRLDVAAVLSSLYPVSTIVLAATLLHERVTRAHALGIAAAGVAVVLIAGGS